LPERPLSRAGESMPYRQFRARTSRKSRADSCRIGCGRRCSSFHYGIIEIEDGAGKGGRGQVLVGSQRELLVVQMLEDDGLAIVWEAAGEQAEGVFNWVVGLRCACANFFGGFD